MEKKKNAFLSWIQEIYEQFQLNKEDILGSYAVFFISVMIAVIACSILNASIMGDNNMFVLMYCFMAGISCLITVITSILLFKAHFAWGIGMSRTRNEMIRRLGSLVMGMHGVLLVLSWTIYKLVVFCHEVAGQTGIFELSELGISLWGWIFIIFLPVVGGSFAGSIVARFGKKGGTILYFTFLACCFAPSVLLEMGLFNHVDFTILIENSVMACIAMGVVVVIGGVDVVLLKSVKVR